MNYLNYQLKLESDSPSNTIENLESFIREEHLKGLQMELEYEEPKAGEMGMDADVLNLVATIAGSAGFVALVTGLCGCLKEYIKLNNDDKVTLKSKSLEITFDKDSVNDLQHLIEDFIAVEGGKNSEEAE